MNRARTALLVYPLLSLLGCGEGSPAGLADGSSAETQSAEASETPMSLPPPTCKYGDPVPELMLPASDTKGVLHGESRNASTTCTRQQGTGGPDTVYFMRVKERSVIDIE